MEFEVSRGEVEKLLDCFLIGTQNVTLGARISNINELPLEWRDRMRAVESAGRAWIAWTTDNGPVVAWGDYHAQESVRLKAHVLFVEWYSSLHDYHAAWCHCYPSWPYEWIFRASARS
jgi:hypothetical protein